MPTNPRPIRILTVDDHALLRVGIAALVSGEADMELVGEACNGQEALEKYRLHRPDITLMDIQMPLMNGVETIIGIRDEFPNARIIVLSTYAGDVQVLRALKAGARAYIRKGHVHRELLDTIRAVHAGQKRESVWAEQMFTIIVLGTPAIFVYLPKTNPRLGSALKEI
jgi:DNA-binding NarL/FixJ family response regulator